MRITVLLLIYSMLLWCSPGQAQEDPFAGSFSAEIDGSQYRLSIDCVDASTYDGLLWIDAEKMQLDGRRYGEQMVGRLANESHQSGFRAHIEGSAPLLEIEISGRVILWRDAAAKNQGG
jgi:hypothetical protein